jgi:hypothetical protein
MRDPNQGPPLAWIALGLIVALAVAATFFIGPLCPQPESWRDYKRTDPAPTPAPNAPAPAVE